MSAHELLDDPVEPKPPRWLVVVVEALAELVVELPVVALLPLVVLPPRVKDDPLVARLPLVLLPVLAPDDCCGGQAWPGGQGTAATGGR
jgi:hypothetical protein